MKSRHKRKHEEESEKGLPWRKSIITRHGETQAKDLHWACGQIGELWFRTTGWKASSWMRQVKIFDARISFFFLVVLHKICTATKFFNMSQRHKTPKSTRNHHHDPHHDGIDDCVATPSNLQVSLHKFVSIYLIKRYNALFLVDCCYLWRISIRKMVCRVRRGAAAANVRRFAAFHRFSSLFCAFFALLSFLLS